MKNLICLLVCMLTFVCQTLFAQKIDKIEPLFWWSGMKNPELQLMVYGKDISQFYVTVDYPGIFLKSKVTFESPNYLIIYLDVSEAQPGKFNLVFTKDKQKISYPYELKQRRANTNDIKGYSSEDVVYLLMPDRFANGDPSNDQPPMRGNYTVDRSNHSSRHGGDLVGIEKHLDYFVDLGVTAIWFNPVLENDLERGSYHGYFATDLYKIDRRLGTNEDYVRLIDNAHKKNIKVVMDMIFNHIGAYHPWVLDPPSQDWLSKSPSGRGNHATDVFYDPYASKYDTDVMKYGGFNVDVNSENEHVAKYFIQNSIWWIEYARIDAIRQDTYPYADFYMLREWNIRVLEEYPQFNIVGEVWLSTIGTAWWQRNSKINPDKNTELKSVMDFPLMTMASNVFHDTTRMGRLQDIYKHLTQDFVYPDINNVLRFVENHDTDRFLRQAPENLNAYKQAFALLLTIPGTPQLYYGTEVLMNGLRRDGGDGNIRRDMPGGWPDDTENWFVREGRSAMQNEAWDYLSNLLKWRKGNKVISEGTMIHFQPQMGVYVYERNLNGKSIIVFLNGANIDVDLPLNRYAEIIQGKTQGRDVITKQTISLSGTLLIKAKGVYILEM